jgi:flavorubredoxin
MKPRELKTGIHCIGAVDWDRRLFDELIPLPHGTSYNSYLVRGSDRTALIDTVDPPMWHVLKTNLERLGNPRIDYIVCHHAEQDHSGCIPQVLELHPEAIVLCTPKCKGMLADHLSVPDDRVREVANDEVVELGGKSLRFIHSPWVHWPETMMTYVAEDKLLFPCDFLGSHLATSSLYSSSEDSALQSAKRYYAEIMMPFRPMVKRHLATLRKLDIATIAPSHGPVHDNPEMILSAYEQWTSDAVANEVVLPFVSMHGSTKLMVDHLTSALVERGVMVKRYDLSCTDIGELAMSLVDAGTVVLGTPTVLGGPHPLAVYAAYLMGALRPKTKFATVIGSFGWGGRAVEKVAALIGDLGLELLPPVLAQGLPGEADYAALDNLAGTIAEKHSGLNKPA